MKFSNTALFLATVASSALMATSAQAQREIPVTPASNDGDAKLHGTGATSVQSLVAQELNCVGDFQPLGLVAGTTSTIAEPTLPAPAGTFSCASLELQPNFAARYIGSGSGLGRTAWRSVGTNVFTGTNVNPFTLSPFNNAPWTKVQYAFADSSVTDSDLTTFTGGPALTGPSYSAGGAPIQFPKFVLPVAVAYNPVYGIKSGTSYRFSVRRPATILGAAVGGLRMSRATYCGVFNGQIVNFNDPAFVTDNGGKTLKDAADTNARWNADGAPVRLVGRLDRSGTTDIFTRAIAAQCSGLGFTNKFVSNAETLPYFRAGVATNQSPDFMAIRSDSGLRAASTEPQAGANTLATNAVSRDYYNNTNQTITDTNVTGGGVQSDPIVDGSGKFVGSGLFIVADGSGNVGRAINLAPDVASPTDTAFLLNGKVGYIGADFIAGSPTGAGLFAAALQNTTTGDFELPSAARARAAFGAILPPESNNNGSYSPAAETRTVTIPSYQNGGAAGSGLAARTNPLAWYQVLYTPATGTTATLADPAVGYPLTGTTQALLYTCYAPGNREHIVNFLSWNTDAVKQDSTGANRAGLFTTVVSNNFGATGLLGRSNISALPSAWKTAVSETFLQDSGGALGALNLWIQNAAIVTKDSAANPSANGCGGGKAGV